MSFPGRQRPPPGSSAAVSRAVPRSLTIKVALLFAAVILLAFGIVYFLIVPQLRSNLEQQVLDDLEVAAGTSAREIEMVMGTQEPCDQVDAVVRRTAGERDARIDVLGIQRSTDGGGTYYPISDSSSGDTRPDCRSPELPEVDESLAVPLPQETVTEPSAVSLDVADTAVEEGEIETGLGRNRDELVAQAAAPLRRTQNATPEWVAVYSRPLVSVSEAVGLIRRQVLLAGVLALVVALAGGLFVARSVSRRVRRLESAARDVAAGRSVDPLPIDSEDELGQLTRTFNEMQHQLARTERARRDFIANASHELRTPIFSLGGFAELLQDEDLDQETRERFLVSMREQIERLQKLSADLLDLSRLDAGAIVIHPREVDFSEVAATVASEFAPAAARREVRLTMELPADGLEAWCDPDRLAQVVRILLDNALRHTPDGTRVSVRGRRLADCAELTVADTGPGLESSAAERVFERFYTADASSGSGLGLAIAKELVEHMGGSIRLRSRPGDNVFVVSLPGASAEPERPDAPTDPAEPAGHAQPDRQPATPLAGRASGRRA